MKQCNRSVISWKLTSSNTVLTTQPVGVQWSVKMEHWNKNWSNAVKKVVFNGPQHYHLCLCIWGWGKEPELIWVYLKFSFQPHQKWDMDNQERVSLPQLFLKIHGLFQITLTTRMWQSGRTSNVGPCQPLHMGPDSCWARTMKRSRRQCLYPQHNRVRAAFFSCVRSMKICIKLCLRVTW